MIPPSPSFPLDRWYVGALASELEGNRLLARTLLNHKIVLFRDTAGQVAALEDRCVHRSLPLSMGQIEQGQVRCGYHGLLFDAEGRCVEIPGQAQVPAKARIGTYPVREQDGLVWLWFARQPGGSPSTEPPSYPVHTDPRYEYRGSVFHYDAPWQMIHDNLLDLTHAGYVHSKTIGGNPRLHSEAPTQVTEDGETVRVWREMRASQPPQTFRDAWAFEGLVDRWQEIVFRPSHVTIFAGAVDVGTDDITSPDRGGLHLPSFHAVTPETEHSCHYLWTSGCNRASGRDSIIETVYEQFHATFLEDCDVINAQYRNLQHFAGATQVDAHMDAAPNRARRLIARLLAASTTTGQADRT